MASILGFFFFLGTCRQFRRIAIAFGRPSARIALPELDSMDGVSATPSNAELGGLVEEDAPSNDSKRLVMTNERLIVVV